MWYKIVYKNTIIDALADPSFIKIQRKHNQKILCPKEEATYVLSSDEETAYSLADHLLLGISEEEYNELRELLFASGGAIEKERIDGYDVEVQRVYKYSTTARLEVEDLKERLAAAALKNEELRQSNENLENHVAELTQANSELEDCLLEISEIIYA